MEPQLGTSMGLTVPMIMSIISTTGKSPMSAVRRSSVEMTNASVDQR
jgi:hypothetical protein